MQPLNPKVLRFHLISSLLLGSLFSLYFWIVSATLNFYSSTVFVGLSIISYLMTRSNYHQQAAVLQSSAFFVVITFWIITSGGLDSPFIIWLIPPIFLAAAIVGWRWSFLIMLLSFLLIIYLFVFNQNLNDFNKISDDTRQSMFVVSIISSLSLVSYFLILMFKALEKKSITLADERVQLKQHLSLLEDIDKISDVLATNLSPEKKILDVLETVKSMFNVDRAWLLYPCEPDAPTFSIPFEVSNPDYPGAKKFGPQPIQGMIADVMREILASKKPLMFNSGHPSFETELLKAFKVKAQITFTIFPKVGKPWQFGLHHCKHRHTWTEYESQLFETISSKISDALTNYINAEELLQSEEKLRKSEARYRQIFKNHQVITLIVNPDDGQILECNKAATQFYGYDEQTLNSMSVYDINNMPKKQLDSILKKQNKHGTVIVEIAKHKLASGELRDVEVYPSPIIDGDRKVNYVSIIDITDKKEIELSLRRSQKMDALGKLTGGIAHDFNNMLGIISGYAELLNKRALSSEQLENYANHIVKASQRGAQLTKKLLAFSSNKALVSEPSVLNEEINEIKQLLEKTLTPSIEMSLHLSNDLWDAFINKGDFEDAMINICINAMHAMPNGGAISITSENVTISMDDQNSIDLCSGDYIKLSIADNGIGMCEETQSKIFDPFFTTKGESGTGLGLNQVYGFVKRINGDIQVKSEVDVGTTIIIFIPRLNIEHLPLKMNADDELRSLKGSETILVVDDEASLATLTTEVLELNGYKTLNASNVTEALESLAEENIDLVLSYVIMPKLSGHQLAKIIETDYPTVKVQLVSGFYNTNENELYDERLVANLLQKPFTTEQLLVRIRTVLDENND